MDFNLDEVPLPESGWDWATAFTQNTQPITPLQLSSDFGSSQSFDFSLDPFSTTLVAPTLDSELAAATNLGGSPLGGVDIGWDALLDECFTQCFTTTYPSFVNTPTAPQLGPPMEQPQHMATPSNSQAIKITVQDLATIEQLFNRAADTFIVPQASSNESRRSGELATRFLEEYSAIQDVEEMRDACSDQPDDVLAGIQQSDQDGVTDTDEMEAKKQPGYPYWGAEHSDNPPPYVSTPIPRREHGLHTLKDPAPGERPGYNLRTLIKMAILGCPDERLPIDHIFEQIMGRFEYYRCAESKKAVGWKNSVRHQLSLSACFVKRDREPGDSGRGVWWTVDESVDPKAMKRQLKRRSKAPYERIGSVPSSSKSDVESSRTVNHTPSAAKDKGSTRPRPTAETATRTKSIPALQSTNLAPGSVESHQRKSTALPPWASTVRGRPSQILARLSSASRSSPLKYSPLSTSTVSTPRTRLVESTRTTKVGNIRNAECSKSSPSSNAPSMLSVRPLSSRTYSARWIGTEPPKFGRAAGPNRAGRLRIDDSSSAREGTTNEGHASAFLLAASRFSAS